MALVAGKRLLPCFFFLLFNDYYRYICMKEKRITQKQLKKVQNTNTETNEEEKGN